MIRFKFFAVSVITSLLFSCTSDGNKQNENTTAQTKDTIVPEIKENFPKGEIIEKVVCKKDASQSYALYLPATYSTDKTYPIVYAFDAHGTGKLPVKMYKDLAEQYGYILIGSNNSKNGNQWAESEGIAETLFADAQNRLSVNTQRIYLLGFSGGARVANGITILNGAISGVICVGAAAPANNSAAPRNNYTWLGIAGEDDFNATEMRKYDKVDLAGHNVKHSLITFEGKHEWCKKEVMDEAFWWLELCEMRKNIKLKNDSLIKKRIAPEIKQLEKYMQQKQFYSAYLQVKKTINFYDGLTDLSYCFSVYKQLQTNAEVDKAMREEELSWSNEEEQKQYYVKGLGSGDFERAEKEIAGLNAKSRNTGNKNEARMYKRVLSYLSLTAYMQASGALKAKQMPAAAYFCKIYILVDPSNSEAHYLNASLKALEANPKEAIASLKNAVKNGFSDLPRLQTDSAFFTIQNAPEFLEIVKKVGEKQKE